jgi:hypothetical protein
MVSRAATRNLGATEDINLYIAILGDVCPVSYCGPNGEHPKILWNLLRILASMYGSHTVVKAMYKYWYRDFFKTKSLSLHPFLFIKQSYVM